MAICSHIRLQAYPPDSRARRKGHGSFNGRTWRIAAIPTLKPPHAPQIAEPRKSSLHTYSP
ncbi:hypothetical protein [Kingella denitrificans]